MIYISKGHKRKDPNRDTGAVHGETVEVEEIHYITSMLVTMLAENDISFALLEDMTLRDTINYLNKVMTSQDLAIEIHIDSFTEDDNRRIGIYVSKTPTKLATFFVSAWNKVVEPLKDKKVSRLSWVRIPERVLGFIHRVKETTIIVELGKVQDENAKNNREVYAGILKDVLVEYNNIFKQKGNFAPIK